MIFPILGGIFSFRHAPVTWMLFAINLMVMVMTFPEAEKAQKELQSHLRDRTFTSMQGRYFAEYVRNHPENYPMTIRNLAEKREPSGDFSRRQLLGSIAMRDQMFLNDAPTMEFQGDKVGQIWWMEKLSKIQAVKEFHPTYSFGITSEQKSWFECLSYQFSHAGIGHFVGNMIFLLIFASNIELVLGGLTVLTLYLLSGFFAALTFLLLNDASAIPLVGASGSVSGIMAFAAVAFAGKAHRYFYFLFIPRRGFFGIVYLPVWIMVILWAISDLAGYLSSPSELSGVAYSAHLGGEVCGVLFGLIALGLSKLNGRPLVGDHPLLQTEPALTRYN